MEGLQTGSFFPWDLPSSLLVSEAKELRTASEAFCLNLKEANKKPRKQAISNTLPPVKKILESSATFKKLNERGGMIKKLRRLSLMLDRIHTYLNELRKFNQSSEALISNFSKPTTRSSISAVLKSEKDRLTSMQTLVNTKLDILQKILLNEESVFRKIGSHIDLSNITSFVKDIERIQQCEQVESDEVVLAIAEIFDITKNTPKAVKKLLIDVNNTFQEMKAKYQAEAESQLAELNRMKRQLEKSASLIENSGVKPSKLHLENIRRLSLIEHRLRTESRCNSSVAQLLSKFIQERNRWNIYVDKLYCSGNFKIKA